MTALSKPAAGRGVTLALACATFLAAGMMLSSLGPSIANIAARAGHEVATLGSLFSAFSSGVILAQFFVGPAGERYGLRLELALGMGVMGSGMLGVTLASQLAGLLVGELWAGIGFGIILAAGNVLIARLFPNHSAAALNGVNVFFGVGSIMGPAIAGMVSTWRGEPQLAIAVGAGLMLLLTPAVLSFAASAPIAPRGSVAGETVAARQLAPWIFGLLLFVYTGTEVGLGGWITLYLINGAGLPQATAALGASGFWLALTMGRALGVVLGMRLSAQRLLALALGIFFGGAALFILSIGATTPSIIAVLILGLACGPVFPTVIAVLTMATRASGSAASTALGIGNSGGLVIPALMGALLAGSGPSAMAWTVVIAAVAMLILCAGALLSARAGKRV